MRTPKIILNSWDRNTAEGKIIVLYPGDIEYVYTIDNRHKYDLILNLYYSRRTKKGWGIELRKFPYRKYLNRCIH